MWLEMKRGLAFTVVTLVLLGIGYPIVVWGIAQAAFRNQAEGSLIRRADGTIVGSRLLAQKFTRSEYFQPRPSAVDYNAGSTGGSNYGPSNPDHLKAVQQRLDAVIALEGVRADRIPSEMVTASGGGLDPHIPLAAADIQAARVARVRGATLDRIRQLIRSHTEAPLFGFFGRTRVNVLELNLDLDDTFGRVGEETRR